MTVKQKTRVISVYLSVKRQNKWINKAESNLKSDFCSLCMWARCCFYLKVTCCYVIIMWPPVPWQAIPFYLSLHYWGGNRCLIWCYYFLFILLFFALILHMALSRIESVLPQVFSPEWVTAPGMSKSLMGSRQTHIQEMTFTQKVTVRNRADTSHRGCHHIYLIFFILSHVLHLCSF